MRIHRVRIDNFRRLRDFEVSFCDAAGQPRPLTVLVGPNMSGKTSAPAASAPNHEYEVVFRKPPTQPVAFREDVRALRGRDVVHTALALGLAHEVEFAIRDRDVLRRELVEDLRAFVERVGAARAAA